MARLLNAVANKPDAELRDFLDRHGHGDLLDQIYLVRVQDEMWKAHDLPANYALNTLDEGVVKVYRDTGGKGWGARWDANGDCNIGPVIDMNQAIVPAEIAPSPSMIVKTVKNIAKGTFSPAT